MKMFRKPEAPRAVEVEVTTFLDFINYGISSGANVVQGYPHSFTFDGYVVSHENNQCYLINIPGRNDPIRFTPGDVMVTTAGAITAKPGFTVMSIRELLQTHQLNEGE